MKKFAVAALAALCSAMPVAQADEILDFTPLVRDFVGSIPGELEIAVPYFRFNDTTVPADGVPESVTVWFNIFTVGTNTKLHNSLPRTIPVPAFPCTTPLGDIEDDMQVKFLGTTSTSRVHLVVNTSIGCYDGADNKWKESNKTILYSTNASTANNAWLKTWNFATVAANGMNVDADADNELMLTMEVPTPTGGSNAKVVFVNGGDGTLVFDNAYPLTNDY